MSANEGTLTSAVLSASHAERRGEKPMTASDRGSMAAIGVTKTLTSPVVIVASEPTMIAPSRFASMSESSIDTTASTAKTAMRIENSRVPIHAPRCCESRRAPLRIDCSFS